MWGPPKDVEGECNARLFIGDDYGDNTSTMRCQLEPGHEGLHREEYGDDNKVVVTWEKDERRFCRHGIWPTYHCKKICASCGHTCDYHPSDLPSDYPEENPQCYDRDENNEFQECDCKEWKEPEE